MIFGRFGYFVLVGDSGEIVEKISSTYIHSDNICTYIIHNYMYKGKINTTQISRIKERINNEQQKVATKKDEKPR